MHGISRSELAAELARCARLCEEAAAATVARDRSPVDVVSALLLAAAALDTALRAVEREPDSADTALLIAQTLVRDAADAAERRGLDEDVLECVASCRRVGDLCEAAL